MNRGFLPFILGGLLLGIGLDLAGTCPGMIYVEVSFSCSRNYDSLGPLLRIVGGH